MSRVLVLADSLGQAEELQRHISSQKDSDTKFIYPAGITHEKASFETLLKDCRDVIREEDIDTAICMHPQNYLIQAILHKDFPQMRGPSFESVLLCLHRYYNNKVFLTGFNLNFETVEVSDAVYEDYEAALEETGEPAVLLDVLKTSSSFSKQIMLEDLAPKEMEDICENVTANFDRFKALFAANIEKHKHPLVFEPLCTITENWKAYDGDVTFHQVECCVCDDEVVPWAITDLILTSGKRRCLKYVSIPTTLKETSQHEIWGTVGIISQRLMSYGFTNQFFNLLVLCTKDGGVKVVDLDCGIIASNTVLYRNVLNQGDNLKACIQLGKGHIVREPKINPQRHSIRAELRSFADTTVDKVIDLKLAKHIPEVELVVSPVHQDVQITHHPIDGGMHLANVYINGKGLDCCLQEMKSKINEFVKPKSKMNWKRDSPKEELVEPIENVHTPDKMI